jgi:ligand-binding sensor domain-containing protein
MLKNYLAVLLVSAVALNIAQAQVIQSYQIGASAFAQSGLAGNGVTDIQPGAGMLWFGTGNGLSRTLDGGRSFETIGPAQGVGRGSVSAIWTSNDTIWVATAGDTLTKVAEGYLPLGTGLSVSVDNGNTWRHFPQPGETPIQNLAYDVTVLDGVVWIASYGGGVRKSADWGETWQEAAPDSFLFDPGVKLNHRGFSVISAEGALWVGTAGGINKSVDGGKTWQNFNHTNQQKPISGNFIVALAQQKYRNRSIIWAATWKAEGEDESYAVSKTEDGGLTWTVTLQDEKAHNFAFDDSVVYVATDNGLYKSIDEGETWYLFPPITDTISGEKVYTTEIYSAYAEDGALWIGSSDGVAHTQNNGYTWDIFRAFQPTGQGSTPRTYAYPNPFSPVRHNLIGGDGYVRFQYNTRSSTQVTIKVFDFAMDLVATVVENKSRPGGADFSEVWNGRNDYGDAVANGVYFYRLELSGDGTYWGKVMIVN